MFCDKLKSLREEKGLTQDNLAKAIYISSDLIDKYESGTTYPSKENIERLAIFFDKKTEELLENSGTTFKITDSKTITEKINFVFLMITAITSFLISVFVYIPVLQTLQPIFPIELGPDRMPIQELVNFSIFSRSYGNGSFAWLILSLFSLITCICAILSIVYRRKKYTPFLKLASYLLLIGDIFLIFAALASCNTLM